MAIEAFREITRHIGLRMRDFTSSQVKHLRSHWPVTKIKSRSMTEAVDTQNTEFHEPLHPDTLDEFRNLLFSQAETVLYPILPGNVYKRTTENELRSVLGIKDIHHVITIRKSHLKRAIGRIPVGVPVFVLANEGDDERLYSIEKTGGGHAQHRLLVIDYDKQGNSRRIIGNRETGEYFPIWGEITDYDPHTERERRSFVEDKIEGVTAIYLPLLPYKKAFPQKSRGKKYI